MTGRCHYRVDDAPVGHGVPAVQVMTRVNSTRVVVQAGWWRRHVRSTAARVCVGWRARARVACRLEAKRQARRRRTGWGWGCG